MFFIYVCSDQIALLQTLLTLSSINCKTYLIAEFLYDTIQ